MSTTVRSASTAQRRPSARGQTTLDRLTSGPPTGAARLVHWLSDRLGPVSRRSMLVGTAVAGSALATAPRSYALRPVTAYASICGPANTAASGFTVFCATLNKGANTCPAGSFAAGWWKAAGSSWCGGGYRYIVDCNATCSRCSSGCSDHLCESPCWSCSCGTGSTATCDQRRVCCNAFRYGQCNTQVSCSGGVHCRVVSCVPPYQWTSCSTTSFTDNQTAEHSTPYLPQWGAISAHYHALGEQDGWLGASLGPIGKAFDGIGTYVRYQNGYIYDGPRTGPAAITNFSRQIWVDNGGTKGVLGYPTRDKYTGLRDTGVLLPFEHGCIVDSASTTTQVVWGFRFTVWVANGRENGALGYPTGPKTDFADGGYIQTFQYGCITDSDRTATTVVVGAIWTAYVRLQRNAGVLKYPTTAALDQPRGQRQVFEGGEIWRLSGQPAYAVWGRVLAEWTAQGGATGRYGYPVEDTVQNSGGTQVGRFEGGTIRA